MMVIQLRNVAWTANLLAPLKRTPELQVRLDRGESPDAMIWFRERADLNSADLNAVGPQREKRIAEVYRRLVLTASSSLFRLRRKVRLERWNFDGRSNGHWMLDTLKLLEAN